jgi:hypothetical protein
MHIRKILIRQLLRKMAAVFRDYLVVGVFGFIGGVVATRLFLKSSLQRKRISEVVEWAMVEKTVSQLVSMTAILNRLVADIKMSADELTEKIEIAQDLEPTVVEATKNRNYRQRE